MTSDFRAHDWQGRRRQWRLPVVRLRANTCPECKGEDVECTGRWANGRRPDAYYRCRVCDARWRVRWVREGST